MSVEREMIWPSNVLPFILKMAVENSCLRAMRKITWEQKTVKRLNFSPSSQRANTDYLMI